jgi:hypothetical protein
MITVVNMIPQALSGETNQDSEPNLAVNPANPLQIAATAFTPDPMGGALAPIYVSTDGGTTWVLNNIVPSAGGIGTGDITSRFGGNTNRLYASILDGATGAFEVHRTADFTAAAAMTQLESRANEDQPYAQATTVMGGPDAGKDRLYIGVNDFNAVPRSATVEESLDAGVAAPVFGSARVETRTTMGQDGPQVRPAIHGDGTIYAAFYRWISSTGSFGSNTLVITNAELIVVRDDNWGQGATPFAALTDPSDGLAGRRVATGLSFPFNRTGVAVNGQERWGGDISTAVDPRTSSTIYVAFTTADSGTYTVRLVRSTDRGATWSADLLTVANAKNPGVAVNSLGKIGLLYQQLNGTGTTQRWETHFRDSDDGVTWSDNILCTALSQSPARTFSPYLGDYLHLMAMGKDFYGIFSANNTPDLGNFPQGVSYQRNHDFVGKRLLALDGVTTVPISIDPFFVRVTQIDGGTASDFYVRDWTSDATTHDTGLEPSTDPWFYVSSDVWNQRTNVAPTFVNDQPQNEDPQNAAGNFASARISRNNAGAAETVNVEFLVAEFGTGSPYASVATTSVAFAAGDTSKIATAAWTLGATSSTHLCLGVQISTAADPFVPPGLAGQTPGWPTTDLIVINDNNKAQRNMSVHYALAGAACSKHYAILRNASKHVRDMVIRATVAKEFLGRVDGATVRWEGSEKPQRLEKGTTLSVRAMAPGETRWLELEIGALASRKGGAFGVDFHEIVDEKVAINGFRIQCANVGDAQALRELGLLNRAVFRRLVAIGLKEATGIVKVSEAFGRRKDLSLSDYDDYVRAIREPATSITKQYLGEVGDKRGLGIGDALAAFLSALETRRGRDAFPAHATLLHKIDIDLTLALQAGLAGKGKSGKPKPQGQGGR